MKKGCLLDILFDPQDQSQNIGGRPLKFTAGDAFGKTERLEKSAVGTVMFRHVSHVTGHQDVDLGPHPVGVVFQQGEFRTSGFAHPPVGDDTAVKVPFTPQDGGDKVIVVVAPDAVDFVVTGDTATAKIEYGKKTKKRIFKFDAENAIIEGAK